MTLIGLPKTKKEDPTLQCCFNHSNSGFFELEAKKKLENYSTLQFEQVIIIK